MFEMIYQEVMLTPEQFVEALWRKVEAEAKPRTDKVLAFGWRTAQVSEIATNLPNNHPDKALIEDIANACWGAYASMKIYDTPVNLDEYDEVAL